MASPRPSSPVEEASQSPTSFELSPSSKLQAMLNAIDDSSDDNQPQARPSRAALFKSIHKSPTPTRTAESGDESSEEEIVRPRGRMAARMHAAVPSKSPEAKTQPTATSTTQSEDGTQDAQAQSRRRIRTAREKTPEPSAAADMTDSPGLFVTPSPNKHTQALSDDEMELAAPEDLVKSNRFQALVARKRAEKEAKEQEEARKREERTSRVAEQNQSDADGELDDVSDIDDDAGGIKLTQSGSRPTRKAGKKAQEEMNRETQRLARSLQLAHEAKTKKKMTKASLFERFNFRAAGTPAAEPELPAAVKETKHTNSSRPSSPASAQHSDANEDSETPPSSAPREDSPKKTVSESTSNDLPAQPTTTQTSPKDIKGKAPKRQVRVKMPAAVVNLVTLDSDDELEIVSTKPNIIDQVLKKLPAKQGEGSASMTTLMRLANLSSPPKAQRGRRVMPSISASELQTSLVHRAREQAKLERDRRVEELRAKGVHVQTDQERERQRDEVDDMVTKARAEIEEIMQREREDAKKDRKEKKANGEVDALDWDDSDDDSYDGGEEEEGQEEGQDEELELSGSEEEEEEAESGEDEDKAEDAEGAMEVDQNPVATLFETEAGENARDDEDEEPTMQTPAPKSRRSRKNVQILSDDEDEAVEGTPAKAGNDSPQVPTSVLRSATKTFIPGLPVAAARPAGLGMTQMFAGTMDDSQDGAPASGSPVEFMPSLDTFPDSQFSQTVEQSAGDNMILNSQPTQGVSLNRGETQTQGVQLHFSQSQINGLDSLIPDASQMSESLDLTQDGGFQERTPLKQRFAEPPQSTVETLVEGVPESPLVKRKGKLMRRTQLVDSNSTMPPTEEPPKSRETTPAVPSTFEDASTAESDAFKAMEKAARRQKRLQARFDRKKSKATEMIQEQAEESEDEYAGLGGADGEDSEEEDEELAKMMIDDAAGNDADEQQLAGLHAERARAADAAQVDKLFRDITTGMLRKRRRGTGNDLDLSDSDDDGEARRRMKRRQFQKMQKALFADERIGKIAENPRNSAFMKSIEDRDSDDEYEFGDNFAAEKTPEAESQSQSQSASNTDNEAIPESQPKIVEATQNANLGRKRTRMDDGSGRPGPARQRKMLVEGRASSLADVQRSLSSLLEDPNASLIPATDFGSDSEDEERPSASSSNKGNASSQTAVVDRAALKRGSSNASNSSRMAFASAGAANGGFKVPALLRRATTNSLISQSSGSTVAASMAGSTAGASSKHGAGGKAGGFGEESKIKKNAGKKSGVNYFARETERRAAVAEKEKKREAKKMRGVEGRAGVVGGLFGKGSFE